MECFYDNFYLKVECDDLRQVQRNKKEKRHHHFCKVGVEGREVEEPRRQVVRVPRQVVGQPLVLKIYVQTYNYIYFLNT